MNGQIPPSGTYYLRPASPTRPVAALLMLAGVLAVAVLAALGLYRAYGAQNTGRLVSDAPVQVFETAQAIEPSEPPQRLRPVSAAIPGRSRSARPRPVATVPVQQAKPRPRHTSHTSTAPASIRALCAKKFPRDPLLRSACISVLSPG
ncbi:MAG: hypothetical protein ABIS86_16155 [Streptosporangiaceae bacterium]